MPFARADEAAVLQELRRMLTVKGYLPPSSVLWQEGIE